MPVGMLTRAAGMPPQKEWQPFKHVDWTVEKRELYQQFLAQRRLAESQARQAHETQLSYAVQEAKKEHGPLEPTLVQKWKAKERQQFHKQIKGWRFGEERQFRQWLKTDYQPTKPPGLAESIVGFFTGWMQSEQQQQLEAVKAGRPIDFMHMTKVGGTAELGQFLGGAVAVPESLVYSGAHLVGIETPRMPPTVVGATIKAVATQVTEGEADVSEFEKMSPGYAAGSVAGEVLLGIGIGKAATKTWGGIKAVTPSRIKAPVSFAVGKARYRVGGWFAERSAWYKGRVLKSLKHRPSLVTTPPKEPLALGRGALSVSRMQAEQFFWKAPSWGMVEVWATARPSGRAVVSAASSWAKATQVAGGVVHTPFRVTLERASLRKGGLLQPILSPPVQIPKAALRKLPYVPSLVSRGGKAMVPFVVVPFRFTQEQPRSFEVAKLGLKVPERMKVFQEVKQPSITEEVPIVRMWQPVKVAAKTKQKVVPVQRQKTVLRGKPSSLFEFPTFPQRSKPPSSPFRLPREKRKKRRRKQDVFGWKFRVHPVTEPEQLLTGMKSQMEFVGWKP